MIKVVNLATEETHDYSSNMDPRLAVCESYCLANNLGSWFFSMVHNKMPFIDSLPLTVGTQTIACGDWTTLKDSATL